MRRAANQCEYAPISVKVLVYTETTKPNGDSYRLAHPKKRAGRQKAQMPSEPTPEE